MPSVPDFPGKGLIEGATKRTWVIVTTAGTGAVAVGGSVAKRVFRHADDADADANADPIAETPSAPPGAEEKPVPKPKPAKPKAVKPKAVKPAATGTDAPPQAETEPGKVTGGKDPHHALNNPVVDDPDTTESPDPYDTREDPRDPVDPDGAPFGEAPHPPTGAESTSEPPLEQDPEVENAGRPPRREKLDD
ncbi:MAG TPA: hypothetical protein VHA80_02535 [Solirubrobacterales bacterium]|nr:hypothetical protein [Solirubrobacterales bacterium]